MRVLIAIVVIAVLAAIVLFAMRSVRPGDVAVLPNGMRIELLGARLGGATFSNEKRWHKLARKVLPPRWQQWIPPASSGSCSSGTNSITVYLRVTDPSGALISQTPWQEYSAGGDDGFIYERTGGYCSFGGSSNSLLYGLTLRAYPRRQSSFAFSLLDPKQKTLATMRVQNPVSGPFPEWTPMPLPQTKSNGPVVLTLESIGAGGRERSYIQPKWKLEATDPLWAKARTRFVTLHDATGNEGQMLSTRERAWKLSTLVHRENDADFAPGERFILTNLALPGASGFTAVDRSATVNGVELKLHVIASPGDLVISNGVRTFVSRTNSSGHSTSSSGTSFIETWSNTKHFVFLEVTGAASDDEVRIRLRDDSGVKIPTEDHGTDYRRGGGRVYRPTFAPPPGTKAIAIEVILSRPLPFEFTVNPNDLQPLIKQ